MSAAIVEHIPVIPEIKQRSWATSAIVLIDIFALELALLLSCVIRIGFRPMFPIVVRQAQFSGLALGILCLPLIYYWVGLYPGYGMGPVQRLRTRVYATVSVFGVLLAWNYIFQERQWSRGILLFTLFFALVLPPALEALFRKGLVETGICGIPVVILGAGRTGSLVAKQLRKDTDLGFVPVSILDDDPTKWGSHVHGVPVVGPLSLIDAFQGRAKAVLVAMPSLHRERLTELVQKLPFPNVIVVPDLFGLQTLWITSRDLGGILGLEVRKNLLIQSNRILKRLLDYSVALPACAVTLPFIGLCALWIKIVSPGSAFFRQEREGEGGQKIGVFKLRTMYPNAEKLLQAYLDANPDEKATWLRFYKLKRDPRILPGVGWFLRRYSLDELPQLWNVLRGDMSLVGPRPFPYYHLDVFPRRFRTLRTSVMPGLTGLWQVSDRSDGDVTVQEAQDTYYIRNWSLWLDIYILLRTVQCVIAPKGAY